MTGVEWLVIIKKNCEGGPPPSVPLQPLSAALRPTLGMAPGPIPGVVRRTYNDEEERKGGKFFFDEWRLTGNLRTTFRLAVLAINNMLRLSFV